MRVDQLNLFVSYLECYLVSYLVLYLGVDSAN